MNSSHLEHSTRLRDWLTAPVAGIALMASSCALPLQTNRGASEAVGASAVHADYVTQADTPSAVTTAAASTMEPDPACPPATTSAPEGLLQVSHEVPATAQAPAPVQEWPALPPGPVHPFAPPVTTPQPTWPGSGVTRADYPSEFIPSESRVILPAESLSLQNCPLPWEDGRPCPPPNACPPGAPCSPAGSCPPRPVYEPDIFADEYLCDGGDRGPQVHYVRNERRGLDTEDTVAEFVDHTGKCHTKPSTRVCIYAPQFAAVRSATLPQENLTIDRLAGAHDRRPTAGLDAPLVPTEQIKNDQPIGLNIRSRASGLDRDVTEDVFAQIVTAENHQKLINLFEDRAFLSEGRIDAAVEAYLAYGLQAAGDWTRNLNPCIIAIDAGGQELITTFKVEEYTCIEDLRKPGDLKIIKLADKRAASPGDIVTFTIRYENIGDRELSQIRIIDNLTPRLEFIEGSGQSDLKGRLDVEDNEEGSLILRFELEESLPGKSGGTVTFQCRVR